MRFLRGVRLCGPADQFTTRATCYRRARQEAGSLSLSLALSPHLAFLLQGTRWPSGAAIDSLANEAPVLHALHLICG